ncbi:ATP-binding protein [Fimbriimonas ginsengisoli]|uniref:histidine kinase n=1 Tax=Fimbriimonas ginsengisoli Gsoil 348 TaxID=661478 RepID=A0A068NQJ1_FIMGI|nr:ATP-binding protein [Fimbriimonas ginsengisoli]AIE85833.1 sensor histidine kinase [Fimbriimonas ginsengisoli Gsoil 348]
MAEPPQGLGNRERYVPDLAEVCRLLAERAPEPMLAVEGDTHIVRYANPAFRRLFGVQKEELIGRSFDDALPSGMSPEYADLIDHVFSPATHAKPEFRQPVVKVVGLPTTEWSCSMWAIVDADELAVGVMIQVTNLAEGQRLLREAAAMNEALLISSLEQHELREGLNSSNEKLQAEIVERQEAQEALRIASLALESRVAERTAELEAANKEVHTLTYSMAHDLGSPLRAIVATSRILQQEASGALSKEYAEMLERQVHNALRVARMVEDMLQFVRLATQPLEQKTVDLAEMAREVEAWVGPRYPDRTLNVIVVGRLVAKADAALIKIVLQSLMDNAAKFSPEGGKITVGRQEGGAFFVRDEGIGFELAYADRLFTPFQRLVNEANFPGTGIGLANVKRIIERHGGSVSAESSVGKGSTFYFSLP